MVYFIIKINMIIILSIKAKYLQFFILYVYYYDVFKDIKYMVSADAWVGTGKAQVIK